LPAVLSVVALNIFREFLQIYRTFYFFCDTRPGYIFIKSKKIYPGVESTFKIRQFQEMTKHTYFYDLPKVLRRDKLFLIGAAL
jgi:hypothetical protein